MEDEEVERVGKKAKLTIIKQTIYPRKNIGTSYLSRALPLVFPANE
jgi:hypothetical protein